MTLPQANTCTPSSIPGTVEDKLRNRGFPERIVGQLLLPGYDRFVKNRKTFSYLRELERTQWLPGAAIEALQFRSLERLVTHLATNVPYWIEWFRVNHVSPNDLKELSDISKLPTTDKEVITANRPQMVATNYAGRTWSKATGGSTGVPFVFEYTPLSYQWRVAVSKRGYRWAGCFDGDKQAHIWGAALGKRSRFEEWKERLHHVIERKRYYNCFEMTQDTMSMWFADLERYKPAVIVGYTNPLYQFADHVRAKGGLSFVPRAVITGAESLHEFQRTAIAEAFGCEVFNTYGSREFMLIGAECEQHAGLHVSAENLVVEVVDAEGRPVEPGKVGEIAVTDLHNYGMPFVRYRLGDLAQLSDRDCQCGRGLPLIDSILGRSLDMIETERGSFVPGEFFPHLMKDIPGVKKFQIVQEQRGRLVVRLVTTEAFTEASRNFMRREIEGVVGSYCSVEYEYAQDIPLTATGKHRVTISCLKERNEDRSRH